MLLSSESENTLHSAGRDSTKSSALARAEVLRLRISPHLDPVRRSKLGQFMTPAPVAEFMARLFGSLPSSIRLLDAGAGLGALTAAFTHEARSRLPKPVSLDVTAFEIDPTLASYLAGVLSDCAELCQGAGIAFDSRIISEDFVENAATPLLSTTALPAQYDCAILNPPYAKINGKSRTRHGLRSIGIETSNLYSAFVAVTLNQLKEGGQIVAITPRSFCNGPYFEAFRRSLMKRAALIRAHVYVSRRAVFREDDVLQENVMVHLVKGARQPASVTVSYCKAPGDPNVVERRVPFSEVIVPSDPHQFIHLALSDEDKNLAERVRALPCRLTDLGLAVSTGRVVDFRARAFLRADPGPDTVPLIYPCHFASGFISWPRPRCRKPSALALTSVTASLAIPSGYYVLTKRFSSKEERRRVVAAVFEPDRFDAASVGFENHLNYFHAAGKAMLPALAKGLALFLNSTAVDQYFRQFSGHTQVNATDLRNLRFPAVAQLEAIGKYLVDVLPGQEQVDQIVERCL